MNYQQYLLVKLAEESSEVAQMAIKCSLFGYDSVDPRESTGETNAFKLFKELLDFSAVLTELEDSIDVDFVDFDHEEYIEMKREKLKHYFDVAQNHTLSIYQKRTYNQAT